METRRDFQVESITALRRIDGEQLLLETDVPNYPAANQELLSPSCIGVTAREVAKIRGCSWMDVLHQTAENDQQLYRG
ncbi:hypothetical protein DPMN_091894 [Dreissena polymorpha]|uniref:Uncharacterized protein n=1 Tax=Dreissena polymorpha TaxID=45954 RepID=A0A9D4L2W1_DREPO|nr:hypothetical protein DPMN_091894 [Dreissena polymorpha]